YTTLRSLDSLNEVLGRNTSLILRTDAAPFRVLTAGPLGGGAYPALEHAPSARLGRSVLAPRRESAIDPFRGGGP
ncbi:MAG: hypothetical protein ACRET2_00040, partial [Steroidobacteraceae bacterium]